MPTKSPHRDALRLLYLLVEGSSPLDDRSRLPVVRIFKGEARLHALDFWMRNPDYLAEELMDEFDATGDTRFLRLTREIFDAEEPDIRRFPMIRYRFGAYERLDDALAILRSRDLVRFSGKKSGDRVMETDFEITESAVHLAAQIVCEFPELGWYAERAALVSELAGDRGGAALKERQYERAAYAETKLGGIIPPVTDLAKARLDQLLGSLPLDSLVGTHG